MMASSKQSREPLPPRPSRIVAAACRLPNGLVLSMAPPARHHDIVHALMRGGYDGTAPSGEDQGFLTDLGTYVRRRPALHIAQKAEQIIKGPSAPAHGLFSEDVW